MKFNLTTQWMEETFNKFNNDYWAGKLRKPKFEICHTKTILGQFKFGSGQWKIRISDKFDRSEKEYAQTMAHEMIHLYIRQNGLKDTRRHHGAIFYREADRINKYGWSISRTDSVAGCGLSEKSKATFHVFALKDAHGRYFKFCVNPKKVHYFELLLNSNSSYYKEWFSFTSTDDKEYANYAKCVKSCRGYFITKEAYESLKNDAGIQILTVRRKVAV